MKTVDPALLNDADFAVQVTPAKAIEPSKRWRNWWRCIVDHRNPETGGVRFAGFNYASEKLHPSFEVAEAKALHAMGGWRSKTGKRWEDYLFYLGALPDGERP